MHFVISQTLSSRKYNASPLPSTAWKSPKPKNGCCYRQINGFFSRPEAARECAKLGPNVRLPTIFDADTNAVRALTTPYHTRTLIELATYD